MPPQGGKKLEKGENTMRPSYRITLENRAGKRRTEYAYGFVNLARATIWARNYYARETVVSVEYTQNERLAA